MGLTPGGWWDVQVSVGYPVLQLLAKPDEGCKEYPKSATGSLRAKCLSENRTIGPLSRATGKGTCALLLSP